MEPYKQSTEPSPERYHAFDNLRGLMLMLLLVLHASISYMVTPFDTLWPFKDKSTHMIFDIGAAFIHTFRLPLFFVMAGFFGAKLYYERGARAFIRNRLQRIAAPLVVFWVLLAPLILAPFAMIHLHPGSRTIEEVTSWLISPDTRAYIHFFHLWFLFDLLIYYSAMLLLLKLLKLTGLELGVSGGEKLGFLFRRSWGPLTLAAVSAISLLPMKLGMLESSAAFARPPLVLLANAVFFLFGWGLYIHRDAVQELAEHARARTSLGIVFCVGHLACMDVLLRGYEAFHVPSAVFGALSIWYFVYGIMGLFIRYGDKPHRAWRYVADSSYWCYLVHLPVVAWISLLLADWRIPAIPKYLVVLATTVLACLSTYRYFVRSTWIGVLINGRQHPR